MCLALDALGQVLNQISCTYNLPTFPAESPYVVAVGGTQWSVSPQQPIAWTASGSGFSWRYAVPSYQSDVVSAYLSANRNGLPAAKSFNATNRGYPDVAALANNVPMCIQGQEVSAGGTSASAPEFAGIVALLNDIRLNKVGAVRARWYVLRSSADLFAACAQGLPPLGFVNTRLYKMAAEHPGELFYGPVVPCLARLALFRGA
jgi:subtilase family serine protease